MHFDPHLESSVVCAMCVVEKEISFARELHPHRLGRGIISLRGRESVL